MDQKTVMYAHLSVLQLSCSTFKCAYITVFHSTCQETVLHWICITEVPFDLLTQNVTYSVVALESLELDIHGLCVRVISFDLRWESVALIITYSSLVFK